MHQLSQSSFTPLVCLTYFYWHSFFVVLLQVPKLSSALNVSDLTKYNTKWDLQASGLENVSHAVENNMEADKSSAISTNTNSRGTGNRRVLNSVKVLTPSTRTDLRETQTGSLDGIIDLDSSSTTDPEKSSQHPSEAQRKQPDLNALTEEDLLPHITSTDPGSKMTTVDNGGRDQNQVSGIEPTRVQKAAPKHGDIITGLDGRQYRLLRGAPGPVGPPGRRVSLPLITRMHTVLGYSSDWWIMSVDTGYGYVYIMPVYVAVN